MLQRNWLTALILVASAILWHTSAGFAGAQYYYVAPRPAATLPPPVGPGYGVGYGYYPGYGGYWQGQASIIDAYGNLGKSQEEARILRETALQAKLDTKVKTIDVMGYERAHKYWFSDEQADNQAKQVQAAMNNPPIQEVTSGRALNTLLNYLDRAMALGSRGPSVAIDPTVVKSMNVSSGPDTGNAGLLRELNSVQWPVGTEGPHQKELDTMLKQATVDGMKGPIAPLTISKMNKEADAIGEQIRTKFYKSEIDGTEYLEGNRLLERVRGAIKALRQPDIAKMLGGQIGPQGNTVDEVVSSMASKGLTFVSAQPGQEGAYVAMHRAFVNYGLAAATPDTGFRVRIGNPDLPGKKS